MEKNTKNIFFKYGANLMIIGWDKKGTLLAYFEQDYQSIFRKLSYESTLTVIFHPLEIKA